MLISVIDIWWRKDTVEFITKENDSANFISSFFLVSEIE